MLTCFIYPDACYHVMNRGARRRTIFHGACWYEAFLKSLGEAHERFGLEVHAYCLMPNHYHLLVKTPEANLDRAMRHIGGTYTQRHNRLSGTDGPLMRGRYRAIIVQREVYWHRLSKYIHRNPVDCKNPLVNKLEDYVWSSYPAYLDLTPVPEWLYRRETMEMSGAPSAKHYKRFVQMQDNNQLDLDLANAVSGVPILGSETFKKDHLPEKVQTLNETSRRERHIKDPSIEYIVRETAKHFMVETKSVSQARRGRGQSNSIRLMAMYLCQTLGRHELKDIATAFGYNSYGGASTALHRFRKRLDENSNIQTEFTRLRLHLTNMLMANDET